MLFSGVQVVREEVDHGSVDLCYLPLSVSSLFLHFVFYQHLQFTVSFVFVLHTLITHFFRFLFTLYIKYALTHTCFL